MVNKKLFNGEQKNGYKFVFAISLVQCFDKISDSCQDVNILWKYLPLSKEAQVM